MSESKNTPVQKIFYVLLAIIIIGPIVLLTTYIVQTRDLMIEEIQELNNRRELAFAEIRPALLRYREEQGAFPGTLEQLVPEYITIIPAVLQHTDTLEKDFWVTYLSDGETAVFRYQKTYVSGTTVTYDVLTGGYSEPGMQ